MDGQVSKLTDPMAFLPAHVSGICGGQMAPQEVAALPCQRADHSFVCWCEIPAKFTVGEI